MTFKTKLNLNLKALKELIYYNKKKLRKNIINNKKLIISKITHLDKSIQIILHLEKLSPLFKEKKLKLQKLDSKTNQNLG